MKENVSCRVSAYSCTFSSRHNNRPAPTMDRYTHWTSTSHLDKLNSERERERSRYTNDVTMPIYYI